MTITDFRKNRLTTGRLYFQPPGYSPSWIDFGNAVEHKYDPKIEYAEHLKAGLGQRQTDLAVPKSVSAKRMFTLDESFAQGLIQYYFATLGSSFVQSSGSVATGGETLTASSVQGRVYFTANAGISAPTVKVGATVYTMGTDYTFDSGTGAVTILNGGAISNASTVTIGYTYAAITDLNETALTNLLSTGAFKFVESDQFETVPVVVETFNGQCEVTAWGDDKMDKFLEYTMEVIIGP